MATTVTGKLNKDASVFQAGDSTGFGIRIGVKYYDRETKTDQWTNYEAAVFAKAPAQVQFYQSALVKDSIVELTGDKLAIKQYQGQNGLQLSIQLLDAKLGVAYAPQGSAPAQPAAQQQRPAPQASPQPQQGYQPMIGKPPVQQPQGGYQQAPQQGGFGAQDYIDDIPFAPIGLSCRRALHCM